MRMPPDIRGMLACAILARIGRIALGLALGRTGRDDAVRTFPRDGGPQPLTLIGVAG